jgi:hypothetical protein
MDSIKKMKDVRQKVCVQGETRRAGCNVTALPTHWESSLQAATNSRYLACITIIYAPKFHPNVIFLLKQI